MKIKYKKYIKLIVAFLAISLVFGMIPSTQAMYTRSFIDNINLMTAPYINLLDDSYPKVLSGDRLLITSSYIYDYGLEIKTMMDNNIENEYIKIIPDRNKNIFYNYIHINGIKENENGELIVTLNSSKFELKFNSNLDLVERIKLFIELITNKSENTKYTDTLKVYTSNNYLIKELEINFDALCLATNFGSLRFNNISVNNSSLSNFVNESSEDIRILQNILYNNLYNYIISGNGFYSQQELEYTSELLSAFGRDISVYNIINEEIKDFISIELYNSSIEYESSSNIFNSLMSQFLSLLDEYNSLEPAEPFKEPDFTISIGGYSSFENELYSALDNYITNTASIFNDLNLIEIKNEIINENESQINSVVINQSNIGSINSNNNILVLAIEEIQDAIATLIANKQQTPANPTQPSDGTETPVDPTQPPDGTEIPVDPTQPPDGTETPVDPKQPPDGTETPVDPTQPPDGTEIPVDPTQPEDPPFETPPVDPPSEEENS